MATPEGSPEILQRFESQLELVEIIVKQIARRMRWQEGLDDLLSYGREGLWEAARRFDPSRGVPFRAYANYRVQGAVIDGIRSMARLPRRTHERLRALEAARGYSEAASEDTFAQRTAAESARQAEQALSDHLGAMATAMAVGLLAETAIDEGGSTTGVAPDRSPEEELCRHQLLRLVTQHLDKLPPQEATLVRRHYLEGARFDHVAQELGLSKSWASRLHKRAIDRLTKQLRHQAE